MAGEYNFFAILLATLVAYCLSLVLVRKKAITLLRHRKTWNVILLASFAVSGLSGMAMSFLIDSGIRIGYYGAILFWHVELGVVMAVVSVFHLWWHRQYYIRGRRRNMRSIR